MKRIFLFLMFVLLNFSLISCSKNRENVIVVGASSTPHAVILKQAIPLLEELGYKLEIKEMDDYIIPNTSLYQGSLDANYFQHLPYLNNYNLNNGTDLVSAGAIHYEPFGIYGKDISVLAESNKNVLIPNDGSNRTRALLLLEQAGIITLRAGVDPKGNITQKDVTNFNGYTITELNAENIAPSLKSSKKGTLAVINGNYALLAGISISTALETEDVSGVSATTYANIIAVRSEDLNNPKILALVKVLRSEEIKNFINNEFNGAVRATN